MCFTLLSFYTSFIFRMTNGVSNNNTNQGYEDSDSKINSFGETNSKNANMLLKKKVCNIYIISIFANNPYFDLSHKDNITFYVFIGGPYISNFQETGSFASWARIVERWQQAEWGAGSPSHSQGDAICGTQWMWKVQVVSRRNWQNYEFIIGLVRTISPNREFSSSCNHAIV